MPTLVINPGLEKGSFIKTLFARVWCEGRRRPFLYLILKTHFTPIRLASSGNVSISTSSQHPIVLASKSYSLRVASSQRRTLVRSGSTA
jgi:hypothetical protein